MAVDKRIERIAKIIYYTKWKELPSGNFPPIWENTSESIRNWTRDRAACVVFAMENPAWDNTPHIGEESASLIPPTRSGQWFSDATDDPGN
jgi:hypothetical protein